MYTFKEKLQRAWADTAGFKGWRRNLILSGLLALLTFVGQWWLFADRMEAMRELRLSLLVLGLSFLFLPVVEFGWNCMRAPRRLLEEDNKQLRERLTVLEHMVSQQRTTVSAADWKELSDRFRQENADVFADWHRLSNGSQRWEIRGSMRGRETESLCKLAGAMLIRSPSIVTGLSEKVRQEENDATRWLTFLIESNAGRLEGFMHATERDEEGKQIGVVYLTASLRNLNIVSARACIECAARET